MSEEIENCKVCDKEPVIQRVFGIGFGVECACCGALIPFPPAQTEDEAIQAWNKENFD